jgi:hypothetical protein
VSITIICPHLYPEYQVAETQAHDSSCRLGSSHGAFNCLQFFVSPTPHLNSRLLLLHATESARHTIRTLFISLEPQPTIREQQFVHGQLNQITIGIAGLRRKSGASEGLGKFAQRQHSTQAQASRKHHIAGCRYFRNSSELYPLGHWIDIAWRRSGHLSPH